MVEFKPMLLYKFIENLKMIQLFSLIILCQFTIWLTVTALDVSPDLPDQVKLRVVYRNQPEFIVSLKITDSMLANENLPVWSIREDDPGELQLEKEVMERLGSFSMYQDKETSSAAVYFHRDRELHGTIDMRFAIDSLPFSDVDKPIKVNAPRYRGITERSSYLYRHGRSISAESKSTNTTKPSKRTRRNLPDVVYIELLLIINFDVLETINGQSLPDLFDKVVSNSLTLINSADMLFSKVNKPKIKLNIAGIVIGTDPSSFPSLARCQKKVSHMKKATAYDYIDSGCALSALESDLWMQSKVISPDSYDIAILLTSQEIRVRKLLSLRREPSRLWGVANVYVDFYKAKRDDEKAISAIAVELKDNFGSFATVAHEIAHILDHPHHDKQPFVDEIGHCCRKIMHPEGGFCSNCLSWSSETEKRFMTFFSSRNRCFFLNEPRSLKGPSPYEVWTADQQCQCYGYKSATSPRRSLLDRVCTIFKTELCKNSLRCYVGRGGSYRAPIPMDGTPCNQDSDPTKKVCWNRKCITVPTS